MEAEGAIQTTPRTHPWRIEYHEQPASCWSVSSSHLPQLAVACVGQREGPLRRRSFELRGEMRDDMGAAPPPPPPRPSNPVSIIWISEFGLSPPMCGPRDRRVAITPVDVAGCHVDISSLVEVERRVFHVALAGKLDRLPNPPTMSLKVPKAGGPDLFKVSAARQCAWVTLTPGGVQGEHICAWPGRRCKSRRWRGQTGWEQTRSRRRPGCLARSAHQRADGVRG